MSTYFFLLKQNSKQNDRLGSGMFSTRTSVINSATESSEEPALFHNKARLLLLSEISKSLQVKEGTKLQLTFNIPTPVINSITQSDQSWETSKFTSVALVRCVCIQLRTLFQIFVHFFRQTSQRTREWSTATRLTLQVKVNKVLSSYDLKSRR